MPTGEPGKPVFDTPFSSSIQAAPYNMCYDEMCSIIVKNLISTKVRFSSVAKFHFKSYLKFIDIEYSPCNFIVMKKIPQFNHESGVCLAPISAPQIPKDLKKLVDRLCR